MMSASRQSCELFSSTGSALMENKRNNAVEFYRVLLMFFIVLYHSYFHGVFHQNLHDWWTLFFDVLIIWHVDGFVAISGWYGIKFSWKKFLSLYGQILFYSLVGCVVHWIRVGEGKFIVSGGWFGSSYLMLMLAAPLVNAGIDYLRNSDAGRGVLRTWGLIAFGVTCSALPNHLFTGINAVGMCSASFLTLLFVYITARVARCAFPSPLPARWLLSYILCYPVLALMPGFCLMAVHGNYGDLKVLHAGMNNNLPHVWLMALATLMLFVWHVRIPSWLGRVSAWLAPSMFGVYLIHDVTYGGRDLYRIPTRLLCDAGIHPFAALVAASVIAFAACNGIDLCRRMCVFVVKRLAFRLYECTNCV